MPDFPPPTFDPTNPGDFDPPALAPGDPGGFPRAIPPPILLLDPTGPNNSILLSGSGCTAARIILDPEWFSDPDVTIVSGVLTIRAAAKIAMRVTGSLTYDDDPYTFADMPWVIGGDFGYEFYANQDGQNLTFGGQWVLGGSAILPSDSPTWISNSDVFTPDLADWAESAQTTNTPPSTGTPVVTALAHTAASVIEAINTAALGITAANGPGSDGTGFVAAIGPIPFPPNPPADPGRF
jgi:hypothetical protein